MEEKKKFNKSQYINQFIKEKYDRINLTLPVGKKEVLRVAAATKGQSMNEFINALIDEALAEPQEEKADQEEAQE